MHNVENHPLVKIIKYDAYVCTWEKLGYWKILAYGLGHTITH